MRISDWSSDVCSSDLPCSGRREPLHSAERCLSGRHTDDRPTGALEKSHLEGLRFNIERAQHSPSHIRRSASCEDRGRTNDELRSTRSEEHTSELQSLMRISYAVICLKKKIMCTNQVTLIII